MKKPKSIFSGFEAHEIKHTASIEGGYSSGGSGGTCKKELTRYFCNPSPSPMDNHPKTPTVDIKMDEYPD